MDTRYRWWNAIERNRTVIPTPATYAMVGSVGLILCGLAWWFSGKMLFFVLAPGAVTAVFLTAVSTAFRGQTRQRTLRQLQDVRDPAGAAARRDARHRQQLAERTFAIYGLADQSNPPYLSAMRTTGDQLSSVEVGYSDPTGEPEESVFVETSTSERDGTPPRDELVDDLYHAHSFNFWVGKHVEQSTPWRPIDATIEGESVTGKTISNGDAQLVLVRHAQVVLAIRSRSPLSPIALIEIDPPDPGRGAAS